MNSNPLVSIIIPCYNRAHLISSTLKSVLNQSYQNWECLVVDDGSTDNLEEVILPFCNKNNRIKFIKQENKGVPAARNEGIKNSKGSLLQFLDSDDLLEQEKLQAGVDAYKKFSSDQKVIVYSSCRYFENSSPEKLRIIGRGGLIGHLELKCFDELTTQKHAVKARNICVTSAPLYPREVIETVGFFDEELKAFEDWDFNLRCCKSGFLFHHYCSKNSFTLIRLHDNSMMRNTDHMKLNFLKFNVKHQVKHIPAMARRVFKLKRIIKSVFTAHA